MNPEFRKQSNEIMMHAVRRKVRRQRILYTTLSVMTLIAGLQLLQYSVDDVQPLEMAPKLVTIGESVQTIEKNYPEIVTRSDSYQKIENSSARYALIRTETNQRYLILNQGELMAALPTDVVIRFEADGSTTLLNLP